MARDEHPNRAFQQEQGEDTIEGGGVFIFFFNQINCNLSLQNLVIRICAGLKHTITSSY